MAETMAFPHLTREGLKKTYLVIREAMKLTSLNVDDYRALERVASVLAREHLEREEAA